MASTIRPTGMVKLEVTAKGAPQGFVQAFDAAEPAAVGPARRRRPRTSASPRAGASHMRSSTPCGWPTIACSTISSADPMIPSLREKPIAKSSRSAGVASITASAPPS